MLNIEVAAGILVNQNKHILLAQRSNLKKFPLQWEFPGGKLEDNELVQAALIRELKEELGIKIHNPKFLMRLEHSYEEFRVIIHFYLINSWSGLAVGNEGQVIQWYSKEELKDIDLLAADTPVIKELRKIL